VAAGWAQQLGAAAQDPGQQHLRRRIGGRQVRPAVSVALAWRGLPAGGGSLHYAPGGKRGGDTGLWTFVECVTAAVTIVCYLRGVDASLLLYQSKAQRGNLKARTFNSP